MNVFRQAEIDRACWIAARQIDWCDAWVDLSLFAERNTFTGALEYYQGYLEELGLRPLPEQDQEMIHAYWVMAGLPE